MNNKENWAPSKFIYKDGKLRASKDPAEVGIGSRLSTNLIAACYDTYLKEYARGKLLDLGCGKVPLYAAYKDYITENICVDWENTRHKNEYLDIECDLTKKLPFEESEFDTLILSDVLEHIPRPLELWWEMRRVLADRGKIILNVPFYYCLHERPHDYYRYTEFALRNFAESTGFKVLLLKPTGGTLEILVDIVAKHLQFVPLIGEPLAILKQYIAWKFNSTRLGKSIANRTAEAFPYGYFMVVEKMESYQKDPHKS